MPAEVATGAVRMPRRARYLLPRGLPRRGELLAAAAVLLIVAHLLFAQLTLVIAAACYLTGRATRWRASWLIVPALIGLTWTLATGPRAAATGFVAGPDQVIGYLTATGRQFRDLLHLRGAFGGAGTWLPRQFPLAILAGTGEAAVACWLSWLHTDEWDLPQPRPGPIVAVRRFVVTRSVRAGGVVTRNGGCLGVAPGSGARVALSWREADGGVLVCGSAGRELLGSSFQLVYAALRRRKPVLAVDFTGDPGLPRQLAAACAATGVPLQVFGGTSELLPGATWAAASRPACYEPFRYGDPAQRVALVMGMLDWAGPGGQSGGQHRRGCAAYLADVFELLDAAPGDPRVPVLDEVVHLLDPAALRARAEHVPAIYPRREVLLERVRVSASLVSAEPATTVALSRQLRALRAAPAGRWLGQPVGSQVSVIDIGQLVSHRTAALFCLAGAAPAVLSMLARLVCQDVLRLVARLRETGASSDALVWLTGCQAIPPALLADLTTAGAGAGLAVLATTTSGQAAAGLAECTNALVLHRMADQTAAYRLAAVAARRQAQPGPAGPELPSAVTGDQLLALGEGEFLVSVARPPRLVPHAIAVQARVGGPGTRWQAPGARRHVLGPLGRRRPRAGA
jgi:hypothetical protein